MKPWMHDDQIEIIKSYLFKNHTMLEYGSGGSTFHFSKFVKKYISIEHDENWFNKLKENKIKENVELHLCKPNNKIKLPVWIGKEEDFLNYINLVDELSYKHYDIVLIDGRARKFCAKKILNYINENSIVFVHDYFERERYHEIENYYYLINEHRDAKQSLAVFKKKLT